MPFFEKLSELIAPLTSPRRRGNSIPSTPSDAISDRIRRAQLSGVSDALHLASSITVIQPHIEPSSESVNQPHRYAEGFRPTSQSGTVRAPLCRTIPRPHSGMRRLSTDNGSMRRDQATSLQDEDRLFPPSSTRASPNGVPIVPGQIFKKKDPTQNLQGFRPVDKISSKGRESGPVRVRGKQGNQAGFQPLSAINVSRPETSTEHGFSERPLKRQRRDNQSLLIPKVIDDSEDDLTARSAVDSLSIAGNKPRQSPSSSQHSDKFKKNRKAKLNTVDEFRQVEKNVRIDRPQSSPKHGAKRYQRRFSPDDDFEQRFTNAATRQRRLSAPSDKSEVLQSVEIQRSREPRTSSLLISTTNGKRRHFDTRESPDELQGAATVQPAPDSIGDLRRRDARDGTDTEEQSVTTAQRASSPADIQPTLFISSASQSQRKLKGKIVKSKKRTAPTRFFQATFLRFGNVIVPASATKAVDLVVDMASETIKMNESFQIPLQRVDRVLQGGPGNCKVRLCLSRTEGTGDCSVDIALASPQEKEDFCSLFIMRYLNVVNKESKWMDDAFKRSKIIIVSPQDTNGSKRSSLEGASEPLPKVQVKVSKRPKLSTSLQGDHGRPSGSLTTSKGASHLPNPLQESRDVSSNDATEPIPSKVDTKEAVEIPVKKYKGEKATSSRATRSASRRTQPATVVSDDDDDDHLPELKCDEKSKRWQKSLVYPRFGKKKAEVDASDLERLRENEFLNDNLIGFYIRYLEDHLERNNKEVSQRVYFFNSYFFATLTNLPRGKQGINYEGVQKWTRSVDLFSYDYIVVPINEAAHWYIAIICNLPQLPGIISENKAADKASNGSRELSTAPSPDVPEIPNTPDIKEGGSFNKEVTEPAVGQGSVSGKEKLARESLAAMSLLDEKEPKRDRSQETSPSDEDWPEKEENLLASPTKFSSPRRDPGSTKQVNPQDATQTSAAGSQKGRRPKKKRLGLKYDLQQPIIITFDSLNLPRSPTISVLRNYLQEEAKSKRGIGIDTTLIKGMKAQEIPLQPNYSDCGLYLLAYVEKFVQDPDTFVAKLLRKEMRSDDDWPPLRSGLLRRRLRKFLDDLYDEQKQTNREKTIENTPMVDRRPISFLLGHSKPEGSPDATTAMAASPVRHEKSTGRKSPSKKLDSQPTKPSKPSALETQSSGSNSSKDDVSDNVVRKNKAPPQKDSTSSTEPTVQGIVEVPDSQEQTDEVSRVRQSQAKSLDRKDMGRDAMQVQVPQYPVEDSSGEVQVLGTSSPDLSPDTQDRVRKSPRDIKRKKDLA